MNSSPSPGETDATNALRTAEENGSYVDIYNLIKVEKGNDSHRVGCSLHAGGSTQNILKYISIHTDDDHDDAAVVLHTV